MANIKLDWSGATASLGIKGYEVSYKESTDSLWTNFPFITSTSPSGTYTWTGAEYYKDYNFRIRTQDNVDLFSDYRTVNVNTTPPPPNTFNARTSTKTSNSITLFLTGANAVAGIKGHEISYRVVGSPTWTVKPFINSTSGSISNTTSGLVTNTNYEFRVRTRDTNNVWSTSYYEFTESTTDTLTINPIQRSYASVSSGSGCSLELSLNLLYYLGDIENDNILYSDDTLTTPFNGANRIWLVANIDNGYSVKIGTGGVVLEVGFCF